MWKNLQRSDTKHIKVHIYGIDKKLQISGI